MILPCLACLVMYVVMSIPVPGSFDMDTFTGAFLVQSNQQMRFTFWTKGSTFHVRFRIQRLSSMLQGYYILVVTDRRKAQRVAPESDRKSEDSVCARGIEREREAERGRERQREASK